MAKAMRLETVYH